MRFGDRPGLAVSLLLVIAIPILVVFASIVLADRRRGLLMGPVVVRLAKQAMMIAHGDASEPATSDTPVASPPAA